MQENKTKNKKSLQLNKIINQPYKYGFSTNISSEVFPKGLNKNIINLISDKKNDPFYLRQFRLNAYKKWQKMNEPKWSNLNYNQISYNDIIYYSVPKLKKN